MVVSSFYKNGGGIMEVFKTSRFRFVVQISMVVVVLGLFMAACGQDSDDPFYYSACGSGVTCHNSGKCCPSSYPYYCPDKTDESKSKTGCFQSNASGCDAQFELCT